MTLQDYLRKALLTTEFNDFVTRPPLIGPYFLDSSSQYIDDSQVAANVSEIQQTGFSGGVGTIFIAVSLGIFILLTIIGNVFVIVAILTEKNLRGLANKLILSLAVADLMVAVLVMPLSAYNEVNQQVWALGPEICMLWTSLDVLCCTSSILHLLAIAIDRYWAVTDIEYARSRSKQKIYLLVAAVWTGSSIVSFAPVFGWKDPDFYRRLEIEGRCLVSQNVIYQVFATCTSFYIPLIFILLLYWNIFKQARKRIRSKPGASAVLIEKNNSNPGCSTSPQSNEDQTEESKENPQDHIAENGVSSNQAGVGRLIVLAKREKKHVKESTEAKRERKAAKTLMIITGVFIFCWLPFFVMALMMAICESCEPDGIIFSILLWLGYTNSLVNPIIYTIFSPDFKNAFKRMLCGAHYTSQRH
ncbi:5-hydroxytryptamine receptor-like [Argiope bruennichi]|uniref:5-hydroxytryptamine receptor like protein n=1 Tax=Argiope bruennichi TaxID=94029 RepID=A0A8T0E8V8_ARGBR|nr:5-hydroxytryptamine receptor-like [Argiope bruennichi]XP_055936373.1 5-hydroxytryptamine receptor-like [Argiope bruennichi]KAF8767766.1 5-hydroxytryptamine receptor like protein [Argiope bruennichi]